MIVRLTHDEFLHAAYIGLRRRALSIDKDYEAKYGQQKYDLGKLLWQNVSGALGEKVVAKGFNRYWLEQVGIDPKAPDVEPNIEARYVGTPLYGMPYRRSDDDSGKSDRPYVMVIANGDHPFKFRIPGWLFGHEMKNEDWFLDPDKRGHKAYFAPMDKLHPPAALVEYLKDK